MTDRVLFLNSSIHSLFLMRTHKKTSRQVNKTFAQPSNPRAHERGARILPHLENNGLQAGRACSDALNTLLDIITFRRLQDKAHLVEVP